MNLSNIETLVYEAVQEIQEIKRDNRIAPDLALLPEVYNFLRPELGSGYEEEALGALRTLYRRGLIVYQYNISKIPMFGIKELRQ